MAQKSFPWTNNGTGDGTSGGYTALEWGEIWRQAFLGGNEASQGVCKGVANELAVTGTASPLAVNTGAAFVYGKFYQNTASVNLTVTTPVVGTTGGHVILQLDWVAQTVRLVATRNTDGVNSTPSLTQSTSTQWEIRLATFTITTGGVITVTDARAYAHMSTRIGFTNVDGGTATRVPFFDSNGRLTDDAGMVYNSSTDRLTLTGPLDTTGIEVRNTSGSAIIDFTDDASNDYDVRMGVSGAGAVGAGTLAIQGGSTTHDHPVTISPGSATAPIVLGANGQGQTVDGLAADEIDTLSFRRQGGDATNWNVAGTTNITPTTMRMQSGVKAVTVSVGNNSGTATVTLPSSLSAKPIVLVSMLDDDAGGYAASVNGTGLSSSQFTINVQYALGTGSPGTVTIDVAWMAIGPE